MIDSDCTVRFPAEGGGAEALELKLLEGQLASIQELSFAFRRAASRLSEMSSVEYTGRLSRSHPPEAFVC
jgi:hypothetical protein